MIPLKIAGCVIIYNPDQSVKKNMASYIHNVGKIYVFDNNENETFKYDFQEASKSKITLKKDNNNEGIAKRLNQACSLAIEDGYDLLLTMDQDSYFEKNEINNYLKCIQSFSCEVNVSMFGVNYKTKTELNNCAYQKVTHLITSGSVINLHNYKTVGKFDEDLFIDFVDTDYCFKAILKKYSLIQFTNVFMNHEIGTTTRQRSLKNLKSSMRSIHPSTRLYYMFRNYLYINNKYKKEFKEDLHNFKMDVRNRIKNKILYDNKRIKTLTILIKAFKDYRKGKMGKLMVKNQPI